MYNNLVIYRLSHPYHIHKFDKIPTSVIQLDIKLSSENLLCQTAPFPLLRAENGKKYYQKGSNDELEYDIVIKLKNKITQCIMSHLKLCICIHIKHHQSYSDQPSSMLANIHTLLF